jgi:hypothetical protein
VLEVKITFDPTSQYPFVYQPQIEKIPKIVKGSRLPASFADLTDDEKMLKPLE